MRYEWISLVLVVLLVITAIQVYDLQQQTIRLEKVMGGRWANEFSGVLMAIRFLHGEFEEWSATGNVQQTRIDLVLEQINKLQVVLNNNVNDYRRVYPSSGAAVPTNFVNMYLGGLREDINRARPNAVGPWLMSAEDRAMIAGYSADFAILLDLVTHHFPGWDGGFPEELVGRFFGRAFITNDDMWIDFVLALENWLSERAQQ